MRIGNDQRRARLGVRHMLARGAKVDTPEAVAEGMVALHATDPATVHLATAARLVDPKVTEVERALYGDRTLVRMLGMRRTMFVVPTAAVPVVQAVSAATIAKRQRGQLIKHLSECGYPDNVPDAERWLAEVEESTTAALTARGMAFPKELAEDEPRLRQKLLLSPGKKYEAIATVTGMVLSLLATEGRIVRGRPRGTWLSSQYSWSSMQAWLGGEPPGWDPAAARAELARRWLRSFGPAPVTDLRWWTGWTLTQARQAVADIGAVEVDVEGGTGMLLPDDLDPEPTPPPWVALLPALDPTAMGWSERDWYLGEHRAALFDRNGNVGPTVWSDGRIVGGWAQRGGEVVYQLLTDVGAVARAAIDAEAARLSEWLGGVTVTPRFPTPLQRELAA